MPEGLPPRALPHYSAEFVACRLFHSVDQSITTSVDTTVALDSVEYDTGGFYPAATGVVVVPYSGFYALKIGVRWSANSTNQRTVRVYRNGTAQQVLASLVANGGSANGPRHGDYAEMFLEANDLLRMNVLQDSGSTLTIISQFAIDGLKPVAYPSFTVRLLAKA